MVEFFRLKAVYVPLVGADHGALLEQGPTGTRERHPATVPVAQVVDLKTRFTHKSQF